jgi:hypothetical protein
VVQAKPVGLTEQQCGSWDAAAGSAAGRKQAAVMAGGSKGVCDACAGERLRGQALRHVGGPYIKGSASAFCP